MIHVTSDALYLYNTLIINTWQNVITVYSIYQLADYFDQLALALYLQKHDRNGNQCKSIIHSSVTLYMMCMQFKNQAVFLVQTQLVIIRRRYTVATVGVWSDKT